MSIAAKTVYKIMNWHDFNRALGQRGSLTVWFDPAIVWEAAPSGKRGHEQTYSDSAMQASLTFKVLFGMALRQTTGFVANLLNLAGLDCSLPAFIREAGSVQWRAPRSTSAHVTPRVSPDRAPAARSRAMAKLTSA